MRLTVYLSHRVDFRLVLALPVVLYLAVALFWQSHHYYVITGDEPHYLLITDSLVRDHDLLVENNYLIDTPVQRACLVRLSAPEHLKAHVYNQFSVHNIGLPIMLSVPYAMGGVVGAKIFMALLAGLWGLLLYKVLNQIILSRAWSVLTALMLALGLPFSAGSNQIYPDLVGGMVILFVAWKIFARLQETNQSSFSWITDLWIGFLIAFLPWLHVRFGVPAILFLTAYGYVAARESYRWSTRRFRWQYLVPAAIVICSFLLLTGYQRIAFGNMFGPYGRTDVDFRLKEIGMIFLGLHWDQSQGMFIQQPMLLLGLAGIPLLIKENWRGAILLGALYVSLLLPSAMHTGLYGGISFFGRFWWVVVSLWLFPLAYAVRSLVKRNVLLLSLCLGSLVLQGWLASKWLFHDSLMSNRNIPIWAARSFFDDTGLLQWLPTFRDFDSYLKHPANYIVVLAGSLLIISGWLWHRGTNRLLAKVWCGFLVLGVATLLLVSPSTGSWKLEAIELPSQVGSLEGTSRVATEKDGPGTLIFGPYTMLTAGLYHLTLEYETSNAAGRAANHFDIVYGIDTKVVSDLELPPSDANQGTFTHEFPVAAPQSLNPPFQFRVTYAGHGNLKVKRLTITPMSFQ